MDNMFSYASTFNKNLNNWCVENIAVEPDNFSTSSGLAAENHPLWGQTCSPVVSIEEVSGPLTYELLQNYPNTFNPSTNINYSLEKPGMVRLRIYNVMGQLVNTLVTERKAEGRHSVQWNAGNIASGVYYYRLEVNNKVFTKKMTLIK